VVVVGGSRRKAGKTTVVESFLRENAEAGWTAIKIAGHRHPPTVSGDTARYLAAGAKRAELLVADDVRACLPFVQQRIAESCHTIIESTRLLDCLTPDLSVLVVDMGAGIKESCRRHLDRADVLILVRRRAAPVRAALP